MTIPTPDELARLARGMTKGHIGCQWCGAHPIRDVLDGDPLCQSCCEKWERGEGLALRDWIKEEG